MKDINNAIILIDNYVRQESNKFDSNDIVNILNSLNIVKENIKGVKWKKK